MDILDLIKDRRTAKQFDSSIVDKESLKRILEAGRLAPSAKNRQPWRFIAIIDASVKEKLRYLCYEDDRIANAWTVIVFCTTNIDYKMPNGQLSYPMDISFAASSMLMQAQYEGLGSALLTTYQEDGIKDLLSVPYSMRVPLLLMVGKEVKNGEVQVRLESKRVISFDHW